MKIKDTNVTELHWEWKGDLEIEEVQKALTPFGLHVYAHPHRESSSVNGCIVADRPLVGKELPAIAEALWVDEH